MATNNKPKIYLDACCYIDLAQEDAGYQPDGSKDHVWYCRQFLDAAKQKDVEVYGSILLITECTYVRDGRNKVLNEEVKNLFRAMLLSGKTVTPIQPTPTIAERARDLSWSDEFSFGSMDSVHLATALIHKCNLFITRDKKIIDNKDKLKTLSISVGHADTFKSWLPDKYKQQTLPMKHSKKKRK